jgi:hypothetical protein
MTDWSTAETWLERIKSQHRSSPGGYAWHQFWEWLDNAAAHGAGEPPRPFILAASGESAASKFRRLRDQLRWAYDFGILADALRWLDARPLEEWNICLPGRWGESFYPTFGDVVDDEGDERN